MAGVGGDDAAGSLRAVERQRVDAEVAQPERLLEAGAKRRRLCRKRVRFAASASQPREAARAAPGRVHIPLNLTERDRAVGQAAILVEDRVVRVLPALLHEAVRRVPLVFDESVAVDVAVPVDPLQRRLNVRPDAIDQLAVAGPQVVLGGEDDEERRGVVAAVVQAERNLAEGSHLAIADLVHDLAGLRIAFVIDRRSPVRPRG